MRRALLVATVTLLSCGVVASVSSAAIEQPFTPRYSANEPGGIAVAANTLMTCPTADPNCSAAQQGNAAVALNNNSYTMRFVDVDADPGTFNSSSAVLSLPAGSTVLFAGLYYGGRTSAGSGGAAAPATASRGTVRLTTPAAGASTALPASVSDSAQVTNAYVGFADVTPQVSAAGAGTYTVANVQAGTGLDRYAGWALVVAYRNAASPARNLSVFDGLATIQQGDPPLSIPVSGFVTPPSGAVSSTVGLVAYEGDRSAVGDRATLEGQPLSDAVHPANNVFNSTIATLGSLVTAKTPDYANQLGFDAGLIAANGIIANGATSATLVQSTTLEQYLTQVVSLATDLRAPSLTAAKSVTNVSNPGGVNAPGDVLRYTASVGNTGQDSAAGAQLVDAIPAGTAYVPGSLRVDGVAATDRGADDAGEYDAALDRVVARPGAGGTIAPGASATVSFEARIDNGLPTGTAIVNTAHATAHGLSVPSLVVAADSPTVTTIVTAPPVAVTSTLTPASPEAGAIVLHRIVVENPGGEALQVVRVIDDLSPGSEVVSATATQGTCRRGPPATCDVGTIQPGRSVVVVVRVRPSLPGTLAARPKITARGISVTGRRVTVRVRPGSARISITQRAGQPAAFPGSRVRFRITVRSLRAADATAVRVCERMPAGLALRSAPGAAIRRGQACWTVRALGRGSPRTFTVVAALTRRQSGTIAPVATARASNAATRTAAAPIRVLSDSPCLLRAAPPAFARAAC